MSEDVEVDEHGWGSALSESLDRVTASQPAPEAPAAATENAAPAATTEVTTSPEGAPEGRARDEGGRFVKQDDKPGAAAKGNEAPRPTSSGAQAGAVIGAPPQAAPAAPPAPLFKPPQSWKPALREKWGTLPAEVQAEVDRREREIVKALQTSAEAEKGTGAWNEVVRPYEAQIRSAGGNPQQYVGSLLQTAHALAYGNPQQQGEVLSNIILQYGAHLLQQDADGNAPLDRMLVAKMQAMRTGQQPQYRQQPPIDEEAILRRVEERAQAAADERFAAIELEKARPELEYFDDLADDMAKVIDAGLAKNYQDAYALALQLPQNSETLALVKQKEAAKSAANAQASTQRAKAAASSIRGTPGSASGNAPPGDGWDAHLSASADKAGW